MACSCIGEISNFTQTVVDTTAAVLELELTFVDTNLVIVAATGRHRQLVGERLSAGGTSTFVASRRVPVFIPIPREHEICPNCSVRGSCEEMAGLCQQPPGQAGSGPAVTSKPVLVYPQVAFEGSGKTLANTCPRGTSSPSNMVDWAFSVPLYTWNSLMSCS